MVYGLVWGWMIGFLIVNVVWNLFEWILVVGVYMVNFLVDGYWYGGMVLVGYNVIFG